MSDIFNQPAVVCADCGRALYGTEVCCHGPGHVVADARKRAEEADEPADHHAHPDAGVRQRIEQAEVRGEAKTIEALRDRLARAELAGGGIYTADFLAGLRHAVEWLES